MSRRTAEEDMVDMVREGWFRLRINMESVDLDLTVTESPRTGGEAVVFPLNC